MYKTVQLLVNNNVRKNQISEARYDLQQISRQRYKSSNRNASSAEEMEDEISVLRSQSGWFELMQVCINLSFAFQELPYTLSFDAKTQRYTVRTSKLRKIICFAFHLSGAVVFWTEVAKFVGEIRTLHDDYQYFDLLHSMGWLTFDYPIMYLWFFRTHLVQEFIDELQDSPLLRIASPKNRIRAIAWGAITLWYVLTTFCFFPTRWGVFDWTLENYYVTLKSACELHFGISQSWEGDSWYPFAIFVTFVVTSFQYSTILCGDMLTASCVWTMLIIARDLDNAMKGGLLSDDEVLLLLSAHKRLTRRFNRAFGLLVSVYVVYGSPYYSLHFVDMVEIPGLMNQISMLTYVVILGLTCKWATDILIIAKRRKRWLSARRRTPLTLDRPSIAVFLDDLTWEKYGLGAYYTVNGYVIGQVFSLIATVAIVRIQALARARISESAA